MSYIDKTLVPGERVVYTTRLHWIVMLGHIIIALILIVGGAFSLYYENDHRATLQLTDLHVLIGAGIVLIVAGLLVIFMGSPPWAGCSATAPSPWSAPAAPPSPSTK
ncbi:MAG TPA: hypothetical protein VHZ09_17930 [Acidobacteriaceae bacterium]|jgi:cytochrome b561|nr:hypothetical protein [Acidobacteriaceae bacterium]